MKKKLTLLLFSLLCTLGAGAKYYRTNGRVSTLSTGTKYIIYNTSHTGYDKRFYLYGNGTTFSVKKPTVVGTTTEIMADDGYIWTLEASATDGQYYLKNDNGGKYFTGNTTTLGDTPSSMVFTRWDSMASSDRGNDANSEAADGTYRNVGTFNDATDVWGIRISGGDFLNGNDGSLAMWSNGHPYAIYAVEEVDVSITYNLIYNAKTIATIGPLDNSSGTYNGTAALPTEDWNKPYCTYTYSPTTITSETRTVDVTMNWGGPFEFSSDFSTATWYNMSLRGKWAAYSESGAPYPLYSAKSDATSQTRESMWAFIGDPYHGVRVINRKAGSGQYLSSYTSYSSSIGDAVMDGYADEYTLWSIGTNNNGFTLHVGNRYLYDTGQNGKLRILDNAAAGGATEAGASLVVATPSYYDLALAYIDDFADHHAVGKYFGLKESAVSELRESFQTAGDGITESVYTNTAIPTIEALWPGTANANVYFPPTGQYWIRSYGRNPYRYMQIDNTGKPVTTESKTGIGNIVTLTALEGHKYKIQMQGLNLDAPVWNGDFQDMTASNAGAQFEAIITESYPGVVGFQSGADYQCIHPRNSGTYGLMCYWGPSSDQASGWVVEDATSVDITLNDGGDGNYYTTLSLPFDATISNATAYTLEKSGNYLVPTAVTDNKVPAGTPVLLKGTNATATATINTGAAFNSGSPLSCALTGTYVDITSSRTTGEYILGRVDDVVGFYQRAEGKKIGANKAYLKLDADISASVKGYVIMFDDDETVIRSIDNGQQTIDNSTIYNLAGQRLSKMQKGINIVNGKKILK